MKKNYRICKKCGIHHYENCGTCFGFGLRRDLFSKRFMAVSAGEAHFGFTVPTDLVACPECGSTIKGLPDGLE
jgi:hypothetical protein